MTAALASGGLDSAALLAELAAAGPVTPVYVRTGLSWEGAELRALRAVRSALSASGMDVGRVAVLTVGGDPLYPGHWAASGRAPGYDAPDEAVAIPGRNVVLAGLAAVWAAQRGITAVALGTLAGNPFADASASFLTDYGRLLSASIGRTVRIEAPFSGATKAQLIARYPHAPLGLTLSCMAPRGGAHCWDCNKCRERDEAFAQAGAADPARAGGGGGA